ncbi:MAG: aminotransferase class V-fold PLP-dependent enzyme [Phycisphaeraceae bacterium]|nr:aminotransferase class V-fold PLP-dependent enzyme [Phycisphaeraceae bacterium]
MTTITERVAARMEAPHMDPSWPLDPDLTFLNHGSYGLCPRPVLEAQARYRLMVERDPVSFFVRDLERHLDESRAALATLLRARPQDFAFTGNATVAIATILHEMDWKPGDEILASDHEYMSAINEIRRLEQKRHIRLVSPAIPIPVRDSDQLLDAIMAGVSPRTRLAIVSHITSPSALILPVERLVSRLKARGIRVLVDGAHAPGQIPVDLTSLGADYYVATLHKWVCAPKGSGFLWVNPDSGPRPRPIALSSRASEERPWRDLFLRDFDYQGTADYTGQIAVKDAIAFMSSLMPGGLEALRRRNHQMAVEGRRRICETLGIDPVTPDDLCPSMAAIPMPAMPAPLQGKRYTFGDPIQDRLVEDHRIQVPVWNNPTTGRRWCRVSAQIYNRPEQYDRLAEALREELRREQSMG